MRHLRNFGVMLLVLAMTSCHYAITAPRLWAHNSSAAFDVWLGLWIINIALMLLVVAHWERRP